MLSTGCCAIEDRVVHLLLQFHTALCSVEHFECQQESITLALLDWH